MKIYPASEQQISEVERGRNCEAIVPVPPGESLGAGDTVLFALSNSRAGQQPSYVKKGDSVLVLLTGVTDLGRSDPLTGQSLVRLAWDPLGKDDSAAVSSKRVGKSRAPR